MAQELIHLGGSGLIEQQMIHRNSLLAIHNINRC